MRPLVAAADIGDLAQESGWPVAAMARLYHQVGAAFDFDRLRAAAGSIPSIDHFDRLAVRRMIEDLMNEQSTLTRAVARVSDAAVGVSDNTNLKCHTPRRDSRGAGGHVVPYVVHQRSDNSRTDITTAT